MGSGFNIEIWGFPKIRGTILKVPIIRIIVYWGLYWDPLILGNYHFERDQQRRIFQGFVEALPLGLPFLRLFGASAACASKLALGLELSPYP